MVSFFVHILLIFCSFSVSQEPNAYHGGEMLKWHTLQLHFITIKNRNLRFIYFFFNDKQDICRISIWPNHVIHFHPRLLARYLQLLTVVDSTHMPITKARHKTLRPDHLAAVTQHWQSQDFNTQRKRQKFSIHRKYMKD